MDLGDDTDRVTLPDTYIDKMDMIDIGHILDETPRLIMLLTCLEFLLLILRK